jgi:soluble lytic murein transglycosylase-like protein
LDYVKRLTALIFALTMLAAAAGNAAAQGAEGRPVLDMHRLYQIVGYMYHLDPDLLEAIATAESNGNPEAVSPKGAQGLMQLMPGTARQYRVDHPFDPVENVFGAARFLSYLRAWSQVQSPYSYNEIDLQAMIAAYNAGPRAVEKYGGIPPYAETQAYVRKVLWLYFLGQPAPRARSPVRTVAAPARASQTRAASRPKHSVTAGGADTSLFDKLAEIQRQRRQAMPHESETRAALHLD